MDPKETKPTALTERIKRASERLAEAGRVLSATNEETLRTAVDSINQILAQLDKDDAAAPDDSADEAAKESRRKAVESRRKLAEAWSTSAWDASTGAYLMSELIGLIGQESDESDQMAMLKAALASLTEWVAAEVAEIGSLDDDEVEPYPGYEARRPVREAVVVGDIVPLKEGAVRSDGTVTLKVIQPGWGTSGYYSKEVLERDGPKIFTAGTKNFWDHPTSTEEVERPERSLRDLAGELVTDVYFDEDGAEGPGLYANAKVISEFAPSVNELAPYIGVSIRALGSAHQGSAEGRNGPIIDKLIAAESIDYVTTPGAGGRVLQLFEAARQRQPIPSKEDDTLEIKEALARADKAEQESARLREALLIREARDQVALEMAKVEDIPDITRKRLTEALSKNPPVAEDGKLDTAKLAETVEAAVKAEAAYLAEVSGSGRIIGFGKTPAPSDDTAAKEAELQKLMQNIGLSESEAMIAARGRQR